MLLQRQLYLAMAVGEQLVLHQSCQHPEGALFILKAHNNEHKASNVSQAAEVA